MARKRQKRPECPNCGLALRTEDNFCARCGQENHTHKIPVRHFIVDLLGGLFNFDTKLLRTLRDLFWPPGLATRNYNENKRARYVPPLRLYLFTSLLYFVAIAWLPEPPDDPTKSSSGMRFTAGADSTTERLTDLARQGRLTDAVIDSVLMAGGDEPTALGRNLLRSAMHLEAGGSGALDEYTSALRENFAKVMFVLLPLFALLLKLVHWRWKLYYTEHLVFALHYHTLFFLLLLVTASITGLLWSAFDTPFELTALAIGLGIGALMRMMRTVYRRPWGVTILKSLIVLMAYSILVAVGFAAAAVGTIALS
ncbi:MAG: DUF3667 domain-containing protein [Flavobacteriales bacterium]|jgi:hypothetical protein|nr:DUF3667 domain-containing protein [Flavobacteriales bacterium]